MKLLLATCLLPLSCLANPHEQEIQRALIQRDQQSAEFAAGVNRPALETLHYRQNQELAGREPKPYDRQRMAREREGFVLRLPPPKANAAASDLKPLPLPGGPQHGVQPVTAHGVGG
jgi:hypothetical protein